MPSPSGPPAAPLPRSRVRKLGDMLVAQGIISSAQLQEVLDLQKVRKGRIGRLLVELGYVTEAQLAELVADQLRIPCVDIEMVRLIMNIPKRSQAKIVSRIKIVAHLDIAERRRPQDGRTRISLLGRVLRPAGLHPAHG